MAQVERRVQLRRQADREAQHRLQQLEEAARNTESGDGERKRRRRHTIRHNCKVAIQMAIGHAAGNSDDWSVDSVKVKGRLLDLSASGASLFTRDRFETGQRLRLAIELDGGALIHTNADVRWVKHVPDKRGYASGVQFLEVSGGDRRSIARFLEQLESTLGL